MNFDKNKKYILYLPKKYRGNTINILMTMLELFSPNITIEKIMRIEKKKIL